MKASYNNRKEKYMDLKSVTIINIFSYIYYSNSLFNICLNKSIKTLVFFYSDKSKAVNIKYFFC